MEAREVPKAESQGLSEQEASAEPQKVGHPFFWKD